MQDTLTLLGLSENDTAVWLALLNTPHQTAQQLATTTSIKRTNVYRILDLLETQGLIKTEPGNIKHFSVTDPYALRQLLVKRQDQLKAVNRSLTDTMPALRAQYNLSLDKPGVISMAGDEGFERLLTNMTTSTTEVLLVASDNLPSDETTLRRFRDLMYRRRDNHIRTRALFHKLDDEASNRRIIALFAERGLETKLVDTSPFTGEIAIYEDNIAFTVYAPSLIVTVITNPYIADTMRKMFELVWQNTKNM